LIDNLPEGLKKVKPPKVVKPSRPQNEKEWILTCTHCTKQKTADNFYADKSTNLNKMTICKDCLKEKAQDQNGDFSLDNFIDLLKTIDKPFIYQYVEKALESGNEVVGEYFKNLNRRNSASGGFDDSDFSGYEVDNTQEVLKKDKPFEITEEVLDRWGRGYKPVEYESFEKKYEILRPSYPEKTAFHTEKLKEYIRFQVKGELALANNESINAKSWFEEARKTADAAKINPKQMTEADLGGKNTFSEWFREVEKFDELMDCIKEYQLKPKDSIDFTIFEIINGVRRVKGMGDITYPEIYEFYDKEKAKFIEEYGEDIFKGDNTEENRKRLEKWITYREVDSQEESEEVL